MKLNGDGKIQSQLYEVLKVYTLHGLVAQLVRAPPCHGGGHGFESRLGRFIWDLSSAGRASALQAEGHRFEPCRPHSSYDLPKSAYNKNMDGFPSGQRGQTVNLLQIASVVRIHLHPFEVCVADFNLCINEVNGTALVRMSMI